MQKPSADNDSLPPERAEAQARREAELVNLLGASALIGRESLTKEIDLLMKIIEANRASLKLQTISAADRSLLAKQMEIRAARITVLRQQL